MTVNCGATVLMHNQRGRIFISLEFLESSQTSSCRSKSHKLSITSPQRVNITMAEPKNNSNSRLTQITDFLTMNKTATTIPWDPDSTKFPSRKELPDIPGAPKEAAWAWGPDDYV